MTFKEFANLQSQIFLDIQKIGETKGIEYASSDDRLANFKRLAPECGIKPELVGWVYFRKHLDSISTYLKDGKEHSEESIRGRFLDAINYLTLIYGLIYEKTYVAGTHRYIYKGGQKIFCKQCKQQIQVGEEYNSDVSGYNHYQLCPRLNDQISEKETSTESK